MFRTIRMTYEGGLNQSALKITERAEWERCIVCGGYTLEVVLYVVLLKWK